MKKRWKEVWKDIEGFEGKYQVSNMGRIRSLNFNNTGKYGLKKTIKNKKGKMEINLWKNNKAFPRTVARLVYETFLNTKIKPTDTIQYFDQNPTNCKLKNLYILPKGNCMERDYKNGTRKKANNTKKYYNYYGKIISLTGACNISKLNFSTIATRLYTLNWNIYEAIETPVSQNYSKKRKEV